MTLTKKSKQSGDVVKIAREILLDKKAKNIAVIDLKNLENSVCDYFIVTHGTSDRHVQGLADNLVDDLKQQENISPWHIEGKNSSDWVLIDYADVVVHIFREEMRDFYKIEELWADAEIKYYQEEE
ncbi:MAG TPA: ribosome silencing factor [Bacteroidales bacterium]|nr:ribosome silencing factor [Bacteroidales bacterium]